ncbi:MAG: TatD family hydrolase, partial [Vulcanimicrobiaceae bacterium]
MIDTHAHIHDPAFDGDREAVLARAKSAGVERIVTVGCDLADSRRALELAVRYQLDATIGIHPHESKDAPNDLTAAFDGLVATAGVRPVAIGETGLDYHYDHSPRVRQQEVLIAQIRYARERAYPLVFHQREGLDDFVAILRQEFAPGMTG